MVKEDSNKFKKTIIQSDFKDAKIFKNTEDRKAIRSDIGDKNVIRSEITADKVRSDIGADKPKSKKNEKTPSKVGGNSEKKKKPSKIDSKIVIASPKNDEKVKFIEKNEPKCEIKKVDSKLLERQIPKGDAKITKCIEINSPKSDIASNDGLEKVGNKLEVLPGPEIATISKFMSASSEKRILSHLVVPKYEKGEKNDKNFEILSSDKPINCKLEIKFKKAVSDSTAYDMRGLLKLKSGYDSNCSSVVETNMPAEYEELFAGKSVANPIQSKMYSAFEERNLEKSFSLKLDNEDKPLDIFQNFPSNTSPNPFGSFAMNGSTSAHLPFHTFTQLKEPHLYLTPQSLAPKLSKVADNRFKDYLKTDTDENIALPITQAANEFFKSQPQNYVINKLDSAKNDPTKIETIKKS